MTFALLCAIADASAALRLPALFSDHLVVQANQPILIWGWGGAGDRIDLKFKDVKARVVASGSATADRTGRWRIELPAQPAGSGGSFEVEAGPREKRTVADVIVGEVWLGSGQSNMNFKVASSGVAPATVAAAKEQAAEVAPAIRYFLTDQIGADLPQDDVQGKWVVAGPANVANCSAVAWYFGLALHRALHRPVGLIVSSVGGTPVQAWLPRSALDATSVAPAVWQRHRDALAGYSPEKETAYEKAFAAWQHAPAASRGARPKVVYTPTYRNVPVRLYNGMIAGLGAYPLRGVIWYQADGNIGHPEEYGEMIQALIKSWREQWRAELPFYYVEMNDMHEAQQGPAGDPREAMAVLREQQGAALRLPKTGVAVAIDLGRVNNPTFNPHFPLKQPLGDRLANLVLSEVYDLPRGEVYSPEVASSTRDGERIRLNFKHARGLRAIGDGRVRGFALQKADGDWVWAEGKVDGEQIVLWSAEAPRPTAVRYAWASNPVISIANAAGLPLRPFRVELDEHAVPPAADESGFVSLFNGKDLSGWDSMPDSWRVHDGAIRSGGTQKNWLIWRGGEVTDFELRLRFRFTRGNSGVQVRSEDQGKWQVHGYQVEIAARDAMGLWHESLWTEQERRFLATAGQKVWIAADGTRKVEQFAEPARVQAAFKENDWNDLTVIGSGLRLVQVINGVVFAELTDEDRTRSRRHGVIALQDHGANCVAEFKDIRLKRLP